MRAPSFWFKDPTSPGFVARILSPLGALYARGTARRLAAGARWDPSVPVVCVGNINAGGTGKTPTVIAVVEGLRDLFHIPHVVSKGYGGTITGPVAVDPAVHKADQVGDEPLLLAAFADVWVSKDRVAGIKAAIDAGATVVVLDDGFQDGAVAHDLSIVVVDAETGFGNERCIPAGPLREPVEVGLSRADLLLSIGSPQAQRAFSTGRSDQVPHVQGQLAPLQTGMDWSDMRALAFAGIGRPEKFFGTLRDLGAEVVQTEALGDHAALPTALLQRLERDARQLNAQLVTTEKDAARLPASFRSKVITLPVRLQFKDDRAVRDHLSALKKP